MNDRVLALLELSNDMLFHKISPAALPDYIDPSLAAGRETAALLEGQDILALYAEKKISIKYSTGGKQNYGVILRGQVTMSKEGCSVEVYRRSIEELARYSAWQGQTLDYEQALRVHLAHEYFHIWEYQTGHSIVRELPSVVSLKVLGLRRRAKINRCEEVAAHAFAKTLLKLPALPNLYDYLYLVGTGAMKQAAFDEAVATMAALL